MQVNFYGDSNCHSGSFESPPLSPDDCFWDIKKLSNPSIIKPARCVKECGTPEKECAPIYPPSSSSTTPEPKKKKSKSSWVGPFVGIVLGGAVVAGIVVFFVMKRRKQ